MRTCKFLTFKGANVDAADNSKKTPRDYVSSDHGELKNVLTPGVALEFEYEEDSDSS